VNRALWGLLLLGASAAADVAVLADGTILRGTFVVKPPLLLAGKKEQPLELVLLVERDDGVCLYAPDFDSRLQAYEFLLLEPARSGWNRLTLDAIRLRDADMAAEFLHRADESGLSGADVAARRKDIQAIRLAGASPHAAAARELEELRRRAESLMRALPELLAARAEAEWKGGRDALRLLAEALRAEPPPEKALALLASAAEKDFPLGDARVWLDWQLHLGSTGATFVPDDQPRLRYWRRFWRKDLRGILSGPILLFTPVRDGEILARCMAHGRLICRVLETLFPVPPGAKSDLRPLLVLLHADKEEYLAQSKEHLGGDTRDLEWTAGHYSPEAGVSRFYWYKDRDAERRIAGTCMHELTHHWLEQAAPWESRRSLAPLPGYWIVEGFATFIEEGIYEVETGAFDLFDPRASSLDSVNVLGKRRLLIPWERFYALRHAEFAQLPLDDVEYQRRWGLGVEITRPRRIFYDQAAATCHYLFHAEGGKRRQALLDFVKAWYGGRGADLDPSKAFGMGGAELGERVLRFAGDVAGGWRPPPPSPGASESR
jgi:hypothetical protein